MGRPTPMQLWAESGEDGDRYVQLLREHGHIVPRPRDAQGNAIYTADELAEVTLLAAARFRTAYHEEHGCAPPDALVKEAMQDALKGKVIG